jgi:membrane-associated protease RseP (regulator of RpoE activity)
MSTGNGNGRVPVQLIPPEPPGPRRGFLRGRFARRARKPISRARSFTIAIGLFIVTVVSTLAAGVDFATAYAENRIPAFDDFLGAYVRAFHDPQSLLIGLPFAATILGILLVHELGHYFTCRYYALAATYPYFIPAPTFIGTMGAFIRIRSPIINRKSLFDVGLSGPVVGFAVAVPAMAVAILQSKVVPGISASDISFGVPLAMRILAALLRPGVVVTDLLLNPIGRAAWVGLLATSLNLLPGGQLDGGHVLYSLASGAHKHATLITALALAPLAWFWPGWIIWAILLLAIGFRHPPLMDRFEPLDMKRRVWAGVGLAIFILSFMPAPIIKLGGWWSSLFG